MKGCPLIPIQKSFKATSKGQCEQTVMCTNFFRNDDFLGFLIVHITEIFHYFSRNIGVILKMDT